MRLQPENSAAKIKKVLATWGFVLLAVTLFTITLRGCVSGCAFEKRDGIARSYKQKFPVQLVKGQPSAIYKFMKANMMYRIFANKAFYAMDDDEDLYEKESGCAIWISGPQPGWLVVQARYEGTIIEKVEEGSCKGFKKET